MKGEIKHIKLGGELARCCICGKLIQIDKSKCDLCIIKEQQEEITRLNNIIDNTLEELEKIGDFYTTPIGEVIHLQDKIKHINKAVEILKEGK